MDNETGLGCAPPGCAPSEGTCIAMAENRRTKHWNLRLDLFEEGDDTKVHAILDTGDQQLESHTAARRNLHDRMDHEIGDEFAAGRALVELGERLLRAGTAEAAAREHSVYMF